MVVVVVVGSTEHRAQTAHHTALGGDVPCQVSVPLAGRAGMTAHCIIWDEMFGNLVIWDSTGQDVQCLSCCPWESGNPPHAASCTFGGAVNTLLRVGTCMSSRTAFAGGASRPSRPSRSSLLGGLAGGLAGGFAGARCCGPAPHQSHRARQLPFAGAQKVHHVSRSRYASPLRCQTGRSAAWPGWIPSRPRVTSAAARGLPVPPSAVG